MQVEQSVVDILGERLDGVRKQLQTMQQGTWAHNYWKTVEQILLTNWRNLVEHYSRGFTTPFPQSTYDINYNWIETSDGIDIPEALVIFDKFNEIFNPVNFDRSWEQAHDEYVVKLKRGLA